MPSKPESRLWYKLRDNTKNEIHWTRIESWATPGIPDLYGIKEGHGFWVELKVHRLKTLKSINLSPHQIGWQIQHIRHGGSVWNLVEHPLSSTLNLFWGGNADKLGKLEKGEEPLPPDWSSKSPYDWKGLVSQIVTHERRTEDD
jgi:hypothetical protein